jgi:hypothetical protein
MQRICGERVRKKRSQRHPNIEFCVRGLNEDGDRPAARTALVSPSPAPDDTTRDTMDILNGLCLGMPLRIGLAFIATVRSCWPSTSA